MLNIDSIGIAQIQYSYHEVMGDTSLTTDTISLSPPNTIDVTFRDMCCASDISTDTEEVIKILSNPVRETLDVKLIGEVGDDFELILYDIVGRRVLSESGVVRNDESVLNIRVDNLPSGVYLLRMRSGSFETVRTISIVR
ncbi:MAG: T9SS type A sorting domain-containing protein [Candidatus Aegiribacteria sp.]|nr:T9SS type A sorting domain-containing protein [Candidatus Aegiribacteria sp.]